MAQITPINPTFVADVSDVDLRNITEEAFTQIYRAWLEFGVLRLRKQSLNEDELQVFSARFGPLEEIPMGRLPEAARQKIKNRYVTQLSNIIVDGKPIGGLGNAEAASVLRTLGDMEQLRFLDEFLLDAGIELPKTYSQIAMLLRLILYALGSFGTLAYIFYGGAKRNAETEV